MSEESFSWIYEYVGHSGDRKASAQIAVIGDVMLDEYLDGSVDRISPEAPVPIHKAEQRYHCPGGASNAALNIVNLGGEVSLFSVIGNDSPGENLSAVLKEQGLNTEGIRLEPGRKTTRKLRIRANGQQVMRVDWEDPSPVQEDSIEAMLKILEEKSFDAFLISDYGKGVLSKELIDGVVALSKKRKIPVVVDPKGLDFDKYGQATLITPNLKEAKEALGVEQGEGLELASQILERFKVESALVTLGPKGMLYKSRSSEKIVEMRPKAREVFDVSGAGDCVAGLITLFVALGIDIEGAMDIANHGAGLVVEKRGTVAVGQKELKEALIKTSSNSPVDSSSKIIKASELSSFLASRQESGDLVFTNGCFDILHAGHLDYLEKAKELGQYLMVGVNSDSSVSRLKGPTRPYVGQDDRVQLIAGLACVDYVVMFDEDTPLELIKKVKPDVLVKGADYKVEDIAGSKEVLAEGGHVETLPLVEGRSTSLLVEKIQKSSLL